MGDNCAYDRDEQREHDESDSHAHEGALGHRCGIAQLAIGTLLKGVPSGACAARLGRVATSWVAVRDAAESAVGTENDDNDAQQAGDEVGYPLADGRTNSSVLRQPIHYAIGLLLNDLCLRKHHDFVRAGAPSGPGGDRRIASARQSLDLNAREDCNNYTSYVRSYWLERSRFSFFWVERARRTTKRGRGRRGRAGRAVIWSEV